MVSEDGLLTVVFNGEIYNYPALRAELEADGARFRSNSDTEALLHLYARYGEAMLTSCVECLPLPYGISGGAACSWPGIHMGSSLSILQTMAVRFASRLRSRRCLPVAICLA